MKTFLISTTIILFLHSLLLIHFENDSTESTYYSLNDGQIKLKLIEVTQNAPIQPPKTNNNSSKEKSDPKPNKESPKNNRANSKKDFKTISQFEKSQKQDKGSASQLALYAKYVSEEITKYQYYPKLSQEKKEQGLVKIKIIIEEDGAISSIQFIEKTEYKRLNESAKDIFNSIGSFKPLPDGITQRPLEILLPIEYKLSI